MSNPEDAAAEHVGGGNHDFAKIGLTLIIAFFAAKSLWDGEIGWAVYFSVGGLVTYGILTGIEAARPPEVENGG